MVSADIARQLRRARPVPLPVVPSLRAAGRFAR
jgi:hypothetical protein